MQVRCGLPFLLAVGCAKSSVIETYGTVEPARLMVSIDVDPARPTTSGTSRVVYTHSKPVDEVRVHAAAGLKLGDVHFQRGSRTWKATVFEDGPETYVIKPASTIGVDAGLPRPRSAKKGGPLYNRTSSFQLVMPFEGVVNEQPLGLYRFEADGQPFLVTQFEADDAREAFPCVDVPGEKVAFWLEVTAPEDQVVLSNNPVADQIIEDGKKRVVFMPTPRLPTYTLALAVGPYASLPITGLSVPGTVYTVPSRQSSANSVAVEVPALLEALETWFDRPYPYQKLDFVAVPEFAFGAMENVGLVVMRDELMADPESPVDAGRWVRQMVLTHELAHMWFGNLVTPAWWDDLWLSESFATLLAHEVTYAVTGDEALAFASLPIGALVRDGSGVMRPVRTEVDPVRVAQTTNQMAYPKGHAVLAMTERWLGPDVFRDALRTYVSTHAEGNATAADLFSALEAASGKPVGSVLAGWLDRPGAPLVHFEPKPDGSVHYRQERYLMDGVEAEKAVVWQVPAQVAWVDDAGRHVETVLLDQAEGDFTLPVQGTLQALLPTAEGIGYFVWSQPDAALAAVSGRAEWTPVEQAAMLGDLQLLARGGQIGPVALLEPVEAIPADAHPAVLQQALWSVWWLDGLFEEPPPAWHAWLARTLGPWLDHVGLEAKPGETAEVYQLRRALLGLLADGGLRPDVVELAKSLSEQALSGNAADPDLADWGLREQARRGELDAARLQATLASATDFDRRRSLLAALGTLPGTRDQANTLVMDPATPPREVSALASGLMSGEGRAERERAVAWLEAHYDTLATRVAPHQAPNWLRGASGCDEVLWKRVTDKFGAESYKSPAMERVLAEGEERLSSCLRLRAKHEAPLTAALNERMPASDDK